MSARRQFAALPLPVPWHAPRSPRDIKEVLFVFPTSLAPFQTISFFRLSPYLLFSTFFILLSFLLSSEYNYKIKFLGIHVANCNISITDSLFQNTEVVKLNYKVITKPFINNFFKVDNFYTIIIDKKYHNTLYYRKKTSQPNLTNFIETEFIDNKIFYVVKSSTEKKIVPNFLIEKNDNPDDIKDLLNGLKLVGDFMDKTILKPNNVNNPFSRNQFINYLN